MAKFRANISLVYEFESDKIFSEAAKEVEDQLQEVLGKLAVIKKQIRLERLRTKVHKVRLAEFDLNEVLPFITSDNERREYKVGEEVYSVRMNSSRYFVFKESAVCVCCGLAGSKMVLEQHPADKSPHFNLYAIENDKLILMTKDHVHPKAYGGLDNHSNYQTMCAICNNLKGAANITLESLRELRTVYNESRHLPRKQFRKLVEETRQRLALPHRNNRVSKTKRRFHLAKMKSDCKFVQTMTDIKVWREENGILTGRSIYQSDIKNAMQIACIKEGTDLETVGYDQDKILVRFGEESLGIYQGHLAMIEEDNEKCISDS